MKSIDLYRLELMHGIYTRIAVKLQLGKSGRAHVCRVASGERKSPRVETAIKAELRRIERLVKKYEREQNAPGYELERAA